MLTVYKINTTLQLAQCTYQIFHMPCAMWKLSTFNCKAC